ncbi:hypothetical protein PROFUN_00634 [Planoprotostelium fungivorum]|uniref:Uncharacterized protein n=1 Tax=Planoprotostelium fungivorum TaxID=1890364 RepID=A0A2P6NTW8_9EUKA|nr:hypothetical protein PROFUN_00634 [Planoprotostelium fungivorum]
MLDLRKELNRQMKDREQEIQDQAELKILETNKTMDDLRGETSKAIAESEKNSEERINTLNRMIEELERRYENRESRFEDLETIKALNADLQDHKKKIFQLQENIKFYQLEIVNREENYNRLFSSSPKVGIMNPCSEE